MTDAADFSDLQTLINGAWQGTPVTEDAVYKGATTIRIERLAFHDDELGVDAMQLMAIALAADLDSDTVVGDALTVRGVAYTIAEIHPIEMGRVELLLRK